MCAGKGLLSSKWDMCEAVLLFPNWYVSSGIDTVRPGNGFPALPHHRARSLLVEGGQWPIQSPFAEGPAWMRPLCQGHSSAGLMRKPWLRGRFPSPCTEGLSSVSSFLWKRFKSKSKPCRGLVQHDPERIPLWELCWESGERFLQVFVQHVRCEWNSLLWKCTAFGGGQELAAPPSLLRWGALPGDLGGRRVVFGCPKSTVRFG